jgi:hypothetical protein
VCRPDIIHQKWYAKLGQHQSPVNGSIVNDFTTTLDVHSRIAIIHRFTLGEDGVQLIRCQPRLCHIFRRGEKCMLVHNSDRRRAQNRIRETGSCKILPRASQDAELGSILIDSLDPGQQVWLQCLDDARRNGVEGMPMTAILCWKAS